MGVVYNAGQVPTELLQNEYVHDCFNVYVETEICKPNYLQVLVETQQGGLEDKDRNECEITLCVCNVVRLSKLPGSLCVKLNAA